MKNKLITLLLGAALWCGFFALPVAQTGCTHQITLEAGGAYTDATLATTDQAILAANQTLIDFVAWNQANATFLAKYPQVGQLAQQVTEHRAEWIRNAYAARDAYAKAAAAYKAGQGTSPTTAGINAALSIINDITTQITQYKALHP